MAKKRNLKKVLTQEVTGHQVFGTFAIIIALLLTYNFVFGSSSNPGLVLGKQEPKSSGYMDEKPMEYQQNHKF